LVEEVALVSADFFPRDPSFELLLVRLLYNVPAMFELFLMILNQLDPGVVLSNVDTIWFGENG
jgi:hypothetical protein